MKQLFTLLFPCLLMSLNLSAQNSGASLTENDIEPEKKSIDIRSEIGLNGTYFLKQIINLSDTTIATSPYLFTYKLMFNNIGLRAGLGATYRKEKQSDEEFEDNTKQTDYSIDARIGFEMQKHFHRRWTAIAGLDFLYRETNSKFVADSGFDVATVEDIVTSYGTGPVLGLYFHFNDHLSLYTEAAVYFLSKTSENRREFTNFPQFNNSSDITEITELETMLPATLYLIYRF